MSELPPGWRWSTVAAEGTVELGRQRHPDWHTGPEMHPYLRVANVFEDRIDAADLKCMDFSGVFDRFKLHSGDVLLNEGQSPELLGRPAIYRGYPADAAFTNTLIRYRCGPDVLPEWALTVFRHYMHSGRFARESRITTNIAHLSATRLKTIEFPVPPIGEQRQIVEKLEECLSRLGMATKALNRGAGRLHRLQDRLVLDSITGAGFSGDRTEPRLPDAGTLDGFLPDLPSGWSWSRLGDVADVVGGVTKDSKRQADPDYVDLPYLRVANVQRGRLDLATVSRIRVSPVKAEALRLQVGDVLLNEGGDRDKLARGWVWEGQIENCIHQNHVFRARVNDPRVDPYFLSWTANTIGARWAERNGRQSVNLASISLSMIRRMPVIVPAHGYAETATLALREKLASMARLRDEIVRAEEWNATLRRSLLASAFAGHLLSEMCGARSVVGELVEI